MKEFFLSIENLNVNLGGQQVLNDISLDIKPGEHWAITGAAGSGKSVLAHTLCGRYFFTGKCEFSFGNLENSHHLVKIVEQQHRFKDITNRSDFYYQQRYNSFDADRTITVEQALLPYFSAANTLKTAYTKNALLELFQIDRLLQEPLIQLSNGENKRLQLVTALMQKQELLIFDQPFIGLDVAGQSLLKNILHELSINGFNILLITSPYQIPEYVTHIANLEKGKLISASPKKDFQPMGVSGDSLFLVEKRDLEKIRRADADDFKVAIKMIDVNITYADKNILQHINWEVRKGEKWSLSGPNGAGKSTLLSLITGDNPQAYANEIYLFDKRRGTGETIWEIKKRIGYISPELHLYFDAAATAFQCIASGLFDTIGLFRQLNAEQEALVLYWLKITGLNDKRNKLLHQLSLGEQRFILLARALIKNPPLLILDEPCQGLDEMHIDSFKKIVSLFCEVFNTTLIYVSHYKNEIPDVVDHFLQIDHGMIVK
ncbi:MAG: ATP-binding cassette domain-containing protein [Bacteroidetes bacterium]|nr:ATP-binding cassette domain-containing protein [Bacteroidota bacterium]